MLDLLDVPVDALRTVLQYLEPRDICRCKQVCRKLSALACEDMVWEAQCSCWFKRHGKHSGLYDISPTRLKPQLLHSSFASLYQVLHALGGWPEGVWYRTDPSGQPHGALVWIRLCGSALHVSQLDHAAERTGTFCQILLDTAPVQVIIGDAKGSYLRLSAKTLSINSSAGTMVINMFRNENRTDTSSNVAWHDQGSIHLANDLAELLTELSLHQWQSLFGAWANVNAPLLTDPLPRPLRLLRAAPLPSILPHPRRPLAPQLQPGFTAAHALKRLVGLWTASYGGHGPEILHVWFDESLQSHNGAPVLEGPNARPRLVGCKVTGDPNVPANQWSFVAQAGEMQLGRWNGRGSWSSEPGDELYRPIVKFHGLPMLVDMRERQVLARFLCHGCINHTPGNFQPEWVTAQLLLYEGSQPVFSVLFDDREERFRHIMDFEPVPFPCTPSLSWLHDAPSGS